MKTIKAILLVLIPVIFTSCNNTLDEHAFSRWMTDYDNGLHVRRASGDYLLDLQFTPASYVALHENSGGDFRVRVKELEDLQYYTLTIGLSDSNDDFLNHGIRDQQEKQRLLYYYSYLFQDDITLEDNGTVLPCVLYHFERSADMKNSRTFVLAFENPYRESTESKVVIQSPAIGALPVKIKVSKTNIPALKL